MTIEEYTVILFHSSSYAVRAEKLLARAGIGCKLVPVPRELSSDCGVCVRLDRNDRDKAATLLREGKVDVVGMHER